MRPPLAVGKRRSDIGDIERIDLELWDVHPAGNVYGGYKNKIKRDYRKPRQLISGKS
jgi:hypothetical protein